MHSFFNAVVDRMKTMVLDLPWYRNGWEFTDSRRIPSVISPSMSPSSSSAVCESLSGEPDVGGVGANVNVLL